MSIQAAVVAHPDRAGRADDLVGQLIPYKPALFVDGQSLGCTENHLKAWASFSESEADWCLVLEDDAILQRDIYNQLAEALFHAPTPIVSLYLGQGRPPHWQAKAKRAVATEKPFIVSTTLIHAVAVAVRREYVDAMTLGARHHWRATQSPIDEAITLWAKENALPVGYTNPSLVNHDDDLPSVAKHHYDGPDPAPRVAHSFGSRQRWSTGFAIM